MHCFTFNIFLAMKHLKFLFLPIVVLSILSSVKAACVYDV